MTDMFYDDTMEDPQHHTRPVLRICGHCRQVMRGFASLGDTWLCHPDEGLDCYTAVTLHKHPMTCTVCCPDLAYSSTWAEVRAEMMRDWTPEQHDKYERTVLAARTYAWSEKRKHRGIDKIRAMYRRRKR